MKDPVELYAIDEQGEKLLGSLLEPFWTTLLDSFLNKADEIIVRAKRQNAGDINIIYKKGEKSVTMTPANGFHPFVSSSRIRMISGMNINPDLTQTGKIRARFNKDSLIISVKIEVENDYEILHLKPNWK